MSNSMQDPKVQEHGGKTRLRGKGIGGPHEGDDTWQFGPDF